LSKPPPPVQPVFSRSALFALAAILVAVFVWFRPALSILPVEDALGYLRLGWTDFQSSLFYSWSLGGSLWRPVTVGLAALEGAFFGSDPAPRMAVSLVLYALSGWLIGLLTLRLCGGPRRAWMAAAIWLLLPAHHSALYWLGARAHVLALFLSLCALLIWPRDGRRLWRRIASGLLAAAALAASELGAVAPLLLIGFALIENPNPRTVLRSTWPVWLIFAAAALWRTLALGGLGGIGAPASPAALLDTFSGVIEHATVDPYFGAGWSWLGALGHGLLALALMTGLVFGRRLDRAARWWPLVWLLGLLPLVVADGYAPRLSLFVGLAFALLLATLLDLCWTRFRLRLVLLALVAVLVSGSALQARLMAEDWRRAGEMVAKLSQEFERRSRDIPPGRTLIVYEVPAQVGVAYGVRNYGSLIAGSGVQALNVQAGGPLDGPALLAALGAPPGDALRLVWRNERLMTLDWSPSTPDGLALEIDGCTGELVLNELLITLADRTTQSVSDFRQWTLSGNGRLLDATHLMIDTAPLGLAAPVARRLPLDQAASLKIRITREQRAGSCELRLVSHDPQSAAGHGRRVISKRFTGSLDWRLSGLDPAFRSLWRHAALVDVRDDLRPDAPDTPAPGTRLTKPAGLRVNLAPPGVIEGLRLIPNPHVAEASLLMAQPLMAEIWGFSPGSAAPHRLSARRVPLPRNPVARITVPLDAKVGPLAAIAVMVDGSDLALNRMELVRPFDWPPLEAAQ
jgi:hypothetical protein